MARPLRLEFPGAVIQSDTADAITFLEPFDPGHYAFLPGLGNHWNQYLRRFPDGPDVADDDELYGGAGNIRHPPTGLQADGLCNNFA
jgi:hypothetical protein